MHRHIAIVLGSLLLAASATAQIAEKKSLNLDGARKAITAAEAYAKKVGAPGGVIAPEGRTIRLSLSWAVITDKILETWRCLAPDAVLDYGKHGEQSTQRQSAISILKLWQQG